MDQKVILKESHEQRYLWLLFFFKFNFSRFVWLVKYEHLFLYFSSFFCSYFVDSNVLAEYVLSLPNFYYFNIFIFPMLISIHPNIYSAFLDPPCQSPFNSLLVNDCVSCGLTLSVIYPSVWSCQPILLARKSVSFTKIRWSTHASRSVLAPNFPEYF